MCQDCNSDENAIRVEILRANYGEHIKTDEYGNQLDGGGVQFNRKFLGMQESANGQVRIMQKRTDTVLTEDGVQVIEQNVILYLGEDDIAEVAMWLGDVMLDRIMGDAKEQLLRRLKEEEGGE